MLLARQIPAISNCPLSQVEQTFLLFLLCFQKSKFFMVEDLCRFWHLWTDFNYANVPSIYTFLSRNIYYILLYYCLPHFGLTYIIYIGIYQSCFWLLSQGSEEIYIYTFFFSDSWCFCDLVLSVKFDDQKCIMKSPFFQMCLSDRTSLKLLQQHYGQIWKTKSEFLFWVEKSFFNKEIWHFLIQNQPCPK